MSLSQYLLVCSNILLITNEQHLVPGATQICQASLTTLFVLQSSFTGVQDGVLFS